MLLSWGQVVCLDSDQRVTPQIWEPRLTDWRLTKWSCIGTCKYKKIYSAFHYIFYKIKWLIFCFYPVQSCHHIHHHQDILLCLLVSVKTETAGSIPEQSTQRTDSHCRRKGLPPSDVWETECKYKPPSLSILFNLDLGSNSSIKLRSFSVTS